MITQLVVGARAVVDAAKKPGAKFDYAAPMAGLRALDRYTLQLKLTEAVYPPIEFFLTLGACAQEVVEAAGRDIGGRPVGTGPYMLKEWKRGSRVMLVANPGYRELRFPPTSDPAYAALERRWPASRCRRSARSTSTSSRRTASACWSSSAATSTTSRCTATSPIALLANRALRADLAARGVVRYATPEPFVFFIYFNIEDPVVGGMGKEGIALRRAMMLGVRREGGDRRAVGRPGAARQPARAAAGRRSRSGFRRQVAVRSGGGERAARPAWLCARRAATAIATAPTASRCW